MKHYDLNWLINQYQANAKLKYLYFWGHAPKANGQIDNACFSQWYDAPFSLDNITYLTAEHYMMAQKAKLFGDIDTFHKIITSKHPKQAKDLGRQVSHFDEKIWNEHRFDIVVQGNIAKFSQNPALKDFLLNTGNRILVEASPVDKIWGVGLAKDNEKIHNPNNWQGLNLLGFALMVVRDTLL
ncbi:MULTISPECIES: NADAR family protein [Moraxella]|uniref:NADAR domain-containing protein n=1 Tax=Moraxella lacunata TaxID=477 RepID=A0A1B8Q6D0_MORLA|nr:MULTISPECIES: NADAR family protein [Moraxella]MBE9578764.1 NADAR family protein [Moraxella sp. K1664]MBE9588090.1 NADAR family protein [Moraxella sp. K1630]MBE9589668.1 NADAR family protein [Moraxella sp. K127]MBE9596168.1 NADAR family protein [Moraxella sp. K2450]MDH9218615.1 NADAR family protein [Moraxella lacunata]